MRFQRQDALDMLLHVILISHLHNTGDEVLSREVFSFQPNILVKPCLQTVMFICLVGVSLLLSLDGHFGGAHVPADGEGTGEAASAGRLRFGGSAPHLLRKLPFPLDISRGLQSADAV